MLDHQLLIIILGLIAVTAPLLLLCILGIASLIDRRVSEEATGKLCAAATITGLVASVGVLALMLFAGTRHETIQLGEWVVLPGEPGGENAYHFSAKLVFDRLSVPMAIL